jgi:hypothetical protein
MYVGYDFSIKVKSFPCAIALFDNILVKIETIGSATAKTTGAFVKKQRLDLPA